MTVHAVGQKYHILDSTVIVGLSGKAITMNDLAVPCEVEVTYDQLNKRARNALLIKLKKVLPDASASWPAPIPE